MAPGSRSCSRAIPLRYDLAGDQGDASDVASGVIHAGNEPERDGIAAHGKDDGIADVAVFAARTEGGAGRGDDRDTLANQVSR